MELDFLAVADIFMTPTAALADIVLPVTTYLESDGIVVPCEDPIALIQQQITRVGQCRSDYEILSDIAKRLGLGEYFWDTEQQCLDFILAPAGISFDEFRSICMLRQGKQYRTYISRGFATPSGKVELYSNQLKNWGFDPLPCYEEPPETPFSAPNLANEYPLVLTTWKSAEYRHSEGRQIKSLRDGHSEPLTYMHPACARKAGVDDGDMVYIETKRGRIKQRAVLSPNLDPRVVMVAYGWWFPEESSTDLYGWTKSNVNILTDDRPPFSPEMGSPNLRGLACKVYKASE
jgi:anaerobic selenocysteine-containing dehydrogenase